MAKRKKTPDRLAKLLEGTRAGDIERALTARSERVNNRLSPLEKAALDDLCGHTGLTITEVIVRLLLFAHGRLEKGPGDGTKP